ncbi:uncharacterized protein LOC127536732 [Acanthochromis polyacanthus]|uniref:uncharacterized protein LOC110956191 n=1 Tax=Acanthochromis polyacanthus TaxID=80966 RepID=UPI000B8F9229|nr:uncharacterized protein LOC110956191 [Acanthochromis polyacanthus]XP_051807547.1 uncharacterized protein LOC127534989 [Acanthochromis polyacanthus]XP_051813896.1 uncharacterized protein LOC127536732 [Acanthochromis polyacanthus]
MAPGSFVWTDKESELLLNAVLEYKVNKTQENIDWESCQSKYVDILTLFLEQYPAETTKEFPHVRAEITRATLTTKMKAIRNKYRQAVDNGRKSGFGRVVLLYFELCEQIWGGSPATTTMPSGIETNDLDNSIPSPSTSSSSNMEPSEAASDTEQESSAPAVKQRRELLEAKLRGHKHDRLKRKLPAETQWLHALEEDQRVKKKLVDLLESSEKQAADNFAKMTNTLNMLTTSIAEGFSLLRQVMQPPSAQPSHYMPYEGRGQYYTHTPSMQSTHTNQAFHTFTNNSSSVRGTPNNIANPTSTPAESTGLTGFSYTQALFSDD